MAPSARRDLPPLEYVEDDDGGRFEPQVADDGSPGRIIATMVGIVGILLLGSLFWSALGSLVNAVGSVGTIVPLERPTSIPFATATPLALPALSAPATGPVSGATPGPGSAATPLATPRPTLAPTVEPTLAPTAQPTPAEATGRNPWILLPLPAPGTSVKAGAVTLEARGRGDAPVTGIKLELDGAAQPTTFEQRGDNTWRGAAAVRLTPGQHSARAIVTDEKGRSGAFRWTFEATP